MYLVCLQYDRTKGPTVTTNMDDREAKGGGMSLKI